MNLPVFQSGADLCEVIDMVTGNPMKKLPWLRTRFSRRSFFRRTGLTAIAGLGGCGTKTPLQTGRIPIPTYESIGIEPVINCKGTHTILSGSIMLPEVKTAMDEASRHYVHMDELMEHVGARLADLTGAEWGIVTDGAAAALFAGTAACVAGANPERMALLPDTTGMKNEVLVARDQRHVYDRAIWMVGVRMIDVDSPAEMDAAVTGNTAMIAVLGEVLDRSTVKLEDAVAIGRKHGIPVLVDAAAERPDVPNIYIEGGADLVAYSGGKCLRGPQASGLLLGRKDLCRAAFLNVSPHHALGRPMKVAKEEVMGALAAIDLWINGRDHEAEWKEWERILAYIGDEIKGIPSVKTEKMLPHLRSNIAPTLAITWDEAIVGITSGEVRNQLLDGRPRIEMPGHRDGLLIMPYMMESGEEVMVAKRLKEVLNAAV